MSTISLTMLAHASTIGTVVARSFQNADDTSGLIVRRIAAVCVGILSIAIQPIQMSCRTLLLETQPPDEQARITLLATYTTNVANVAGLFLSSLPFGLYRNHPFARPEVGMAFMSMTVTVCLIFSTAWMWLCVKEYKPPSVELVEKRPRPKLAGCLTPAISQIFTVQCLSWSAWYPFLFYNTGYVLRLAVVAEHHGLTFTPCSATSIAARIIA